MKAVILRRFGGPEVLEIADAPIPAAARGRLLLRVRAAGVNFAETLMRQDRYAISPPLPAILGVEAAGEVVEIGPGVTGFAIGDRVAAPLFAAGEYFGGYAEYVTIDADLAAPIPDALSYPEATALMVQGLTALNLVKRDSLEGKTVLVNAAAGGVGSLLLQLARRAGAANIIAAASSEKKLAFARRLGADRGVDYSRPDWGEALRAATNGAGPDIVYESAGGAVTETSLALLAPFGRMVVYGALNIQQFRLGVPELLGLVFKNQSLTGFALTTAATPVELRADLVELFDLATRGLVTVTIGGEFPLEDASHAHRALEERATIGKLALIP